MNSGIYVIMGVSGSGKTAIGSGLARALGVDFVEGDDYHPPENVSRMTAGIPLTDADRAGWLRAIADKILDANRRKRGLVVSCSALKRSYRNILRSASPEIQFVFLKGSRELIANRISTRPGHFMPPSLLDSQLATLEEPSPEEDAWVVDIAQPADKLVSELAARSAL